MRITGGKARGIILKSGKGMTTRPAMDAVREGVFSSLGGFVEGIRFLDLFAGTGAYGLEALSRGADRGVFVEKDRKLKGILDANIEGVCRSLGAEKSLCQVVLGDVFKYSGADFDLVLIDAPYPLMRDRGMEILEKGVDCLAKGGRMVVEMPSDLEPEAIEGLSIIKVFGKKGRDAPKVVIYGRD